MAFVFGVYTEKWEPGVTALSALDDGIYGMTGLLALMICACPYAGSLCEDMENRFLLAECIRGDLRSFLRARVLMIFFTAMSVMALGIMGCAVYMRLRWGSWWTEEDTAYQLLAEMGRWYTGMLKICPPVYFLTAGCLYGMLAGLLALLAALFSLFTANKLLVLSVPFLAMYLLLDLSAAVNLWDGKLNVWAVYQPFLNPAGQDMLNFGYAALFTGAAGYLLYRFILWRMRWRFANV